MREKQGYVYILTNVHNKVLYTGVTSDLVKRVYEHRNGIVDGFTKEHSVHHLVWYETHEAPEAVILREKQIKKWERKWKLRLIEEENYEWKDLYEDLL